MINSGENPLSRYDHFIGFLPGIEIKHQPITVSAPFHLNNMKEKRELKYNMTVHLCPSGLPSTIVKLSRTGCTRIELPKPSVIKQKLIEDQTYDLEL